LILHHPRVCLHPVRQHVFQSKIDAPIPSHNVYPISCALEGPGHPPGDDVGSAALGDM
jgi:hypothetical protein